jgi:hypothetical protein
MVVYRSNGTRVRIPVDDDGSITFAMQWFMRLGGPISLPATLKYLDE